MVQRLNQFAALTDINIIRNPVEEDATSFEVLIADILMKNTKIVRFNKVKVSEAHKLTAVHLG